VIYFATSGRPFSRRNEHILFAVGSEPTIKTGIARSLEDRYLPGFLFLGATMAGKTNFGNLEAKTLKINGVDSKAEAVNVLTKNANYTVQATDNNAHIIVTAADKVITLPPTIAGFLLCISLAAAGLSASTGLQISPNANDKIMGNGFTSADNKDAILAGSGDREGDSITLRGDGVDGWYIVAHEGTWTREA
jgi:hypothetical protein